ncbi:MAG: hypothetical protein EPN69_02300 [Rhodanobacter sp.]|nr:MAG: hypothetical protein EPN71_15750 [Rhodanobacter sp.]TAL98175.1 MAG: hypothetical protein EPN69_02300 [Rhodanobacter sp.]TAM39719.1 MAG: hypothetical protein EPN58_12800 [Rhodanobacter sp.]
MRNREIEQQIRDTAGRASERVRDYANGASDSAQSMFERGRKRIRERFGKRGDYQRQLSHAAEDFADEANYQYRRLRRQVNRHPAATMAIVAGTIGAFLLLRQAFRSKDED